MPSEPFQIKLLLYIYFLFYQYTNYYCYIITEVVNSYSPSLQFKSTDRTVMM